MSLRPVDVPALIASRIEKPEGSCQWFLLCENDATRTRPHPVLGDVPICWSCDDKMERIG